MIVVNLLKQLQNLLKQIIKMEILLLIGISGSGKSTWAKKFVASHPDYICINRDALRLAIVKDLNGYYERKDLATLESIVNNITDAIHASARIGGYNIVVDNTNLTQKYINYFAWGQNLKYKLFDINPAIAKERVLRRDFVDDPICLTSDSWVEYTLPKVAYIDKQHQQYVEIKKYLKNNYTEYDSNS